MNTASTGKEYIRGKKVNTASTGKEWTREKETNTASTGKESLLKDLNSSRMLSNKKHFLEKKVAKMEKHYSLFRRLLYSFLTPIAIRIISGMFPSPISDMLQMTEVLSPFIVFFILTKKKKSIDPELKKNYSEIKKLNTRMYKLGVPYDYQTNHALDSFLQYLRNYRADTLKECIKAYEQDVQHERVVQSMDNVAQSVKNVEHRISRVEREID